MGRFLVLTNSTNKTKLGQRKGHFFGLLKTGPVTMAVVTIVLVCVLSLLFLVQVFDSSTKGYKINELENKVRDLKENNEQLEVKAAELQSFENIKKSAEKINMVPSKDIIYLRKAGSTVASSR